DFDHDDWYRTFGMTEYQYIPDDSSDSPVSQDPVTELEGVNQLESTRAHRDQRSGPPTLQRELDPDPVSLPVAATKPKLPVSQTNTSTSAPPLRESSPQHTEASIQRETETATANADYPSKPGYFDVEVAPPRTSPGYYDVEEAPPRSDPGYFDVEEAPPRVTSADSTSDSSSECSETYETETPSASTQPDYPRRPTTRSQTGRLPSGQTPNYQAAYVRHEDSFTRIYDFFYAGKAARKVKDPDMFTWDEAMASPHREDFLKAAQAEIDALVDKGTWEEDLKSNATTKIVPGTWVFRIKRSSDGSIKKFKARLCVRGDLQEDLGQDNYSPVAAWSTVRLFLVLSMITGWVTCSIDFSSAFVQSDLPKETPVWLHIPRGYKSSLSDAHCLRLKKSLYGLREAPKLWLDYSTDAFKKLGLKQSAFDPCLWYGKDIMLVQYVDDCGIAAPNQARIDKFVNDLRKLGFELTQEESFAEFLGIKFEQKPDGSIECTQRGLIKKILEAAGMTDCNPNSTPASQTPLGTDKDGEPMKESWNYRGICGMLLYLSTNTRVDIAFAVSQVCRFGHDPKKSHATAVKTILRYLKKTADKGMIIRPMDAKLHLNLYVDSDFCGLFGREDPRDPNSVRSRTGYVIILCGWPIIWKSQLQSHLSQSTLEAEYSALSSSLRVFLPLKNLVLEMIDKISAPKLMDTKLHATVFEDNQSTYYLATNQKITSRTKYLLAKWHWFWAEYNKRAFTIVKCPTDKQLADFLTKSQPRNTFEANRKDVIGW
ncbi:MAG: reverse transcriptase domain-containing protein, partial [bacterium]